MLWNCGDCDSGEACTKPEPTASRRQTEEEIDSARGAVILKYKPASSTDGQVDNMVDESSTTSKEAAMGETSMQRYKRLRYRNEVVMGCPRVVRPGSPTKRGSPSKGVRPGSPTKAPTPTGATPHNTPVKSSKLRAYRLNLERPFNILNEQSPLEYGDYMKIWEEKDYPPTEGPVEYMPPRHLGGNPQVWRTLMQYGRIAQEGCGDDSTVSHSIEQVNDVLDADEEGNSTAIENIDTRPLSYSNWRVLTEDEIKAHQRLGEIDQQTGEYTFRTYDLSHVVERRFINLSLQDLSIAEENVVHDADETPNSSPTSAAMELVTVLSTDSTGSDDERAVIKSEEEMADMTARLFRRSELSLREKSEADARQAAEEKRRKEEEERARKAEEKRLEMEERARAAEEGRKYKRSSTSGSSSSRSKFSSKKLMRSLSSLSNKLVNELNGNATESYSRSGSGVCMNPKFKKSSSSQASAIEKARDLIDNEDEAEEGVEINENKKPFNLYIYGEYDVLNDLVNDGAKRLSGSKNLSDLELLLQNDPCPPPDRWVRPTGWSRCNPSSCYAANPPEGYDLDSYGKNLVKLPKDDVHTSSTSTAQSSSITSPKSEERLNPKDSNATQSTAPSGSTSEDLFDVTSSSQLKQRGAIKAKTAAPSSPVPQVKTLPTESCGTPQGAYNQSSSVSSTPAQATTVSRSKEVSASGNKKKSIGKRLSGMFKV